MIVAKKNLETIKKKLSIWIMQGLAILGFEFSK